MDLFSEIQAECRISSGSLKWCVWRPFVFNLNEWNKSDRPDSGAYVVCRNRRIPRCGIFCPGNSVPEVLISLQHLKGYVFLIFSVVYNISGRNRHPDTGREVRAGQKYVLIQNRKAVMSDIWRDRGSGTGNRNKGSKIRKDRKSWCENSQDSVGISSQNNNIG